MLDAGIDDSEDVSRTIRTAFVDHPNWRTSEAAMRELRKKVTFAIIAKSDDIERVTVVVDQLFSLLDRAGRI